MNSAQEGEERSEVRGGGGGERGGRGERGGSGERPQGSVVTVAHYAAATSSSASSSFSFSSSSPDFVLGRARVDFHSPLVHSLGVYPGAAVAVRASEPPVFYLCTAFPHLTAADSEAALSEKTLPPVPAAGVNVHANATTVFFSQRVEVPASVMARLPKLFARATREHAQQGDSIPSDFAAAGAEDAAVFPLLRQPIAFATSCTMCIANGWLASADEAQQEFVAEQVRASVVGLVVVTSCLVRCVLDPNSHAVSQTTATPRSHAGTVLTAKVTFLIDPERAYRIVPSTMITVTFERADSRTTQVPVSPAASDGAFLGPGESTHAPASPARRDRGATPASSQNSTPSTFREALWSAGARFAADYIRRTVCQSAAQANALRSVGFDPPRGILLHGPAGVGKTSLVRHVMNSLHHHPHAPSHVYFKHITTSGSAATTMASVRRAFETAQSFLRDRCAPRQNRVVARAGSAGVHASPSQSMEARSYKSTVSARSSAAAVILLDDVDVLCPDRTQSASNGGREVWQVAQMLTLLDGINSTTSSAPTSSSGLSLDGHCGNIFVIATTRRPDKVDPALRRAGRLEREFPLAPPTFTERRLILSNLLHDTFCQSNRRVLKTDLADHRSCSSSSSSINSSSSSSSGGGNTGAGSKRCIACKLGVSQSELESVSDAFCSGFVIADFISLARELLFAKCQSNFLFRSQQGETHGTDSFPVLLPLCLMDVERAANAVSASMLRGASNSVGRDGASEASPKDRQGGDELRNADALWAQIGGLDHVKLQLQQSVLWPIRFADAFRRLGVSPQRGLLLHGPPGCAKTTLVRALAASSGAAFVTLSSADVYSPYVGEAEACIRRVFHHARSIAPTIIFLDEIEALVGARDLSGGGGGGGGSGGVQERILATLLTEMDGVEPTNGVVVVGATNRPDLVDQALLRCDALWPLYVLIAVAVSDPVPFVQSCVIVFFNRPGRFDRVIEVGLPDQATRARIFAVHLKAVPTAFDADGPVVSEHWHSAVCETAEPDRSLVPTYLELFARATSGLSGADIESVCREAAVVALRRDIRSEQVLFEDVWQCVLHSTSGVTAKLPATITQ